VRKHSGDKDEAGEEDVFFIFVFMVFLSFVVSLCGRGVRAK